MGHPGVRRPTRELIRSTGKLPCSVASGRWTFPAGEAGAGNSNLLDTGPGAHRPRVRGVSSQWVVWQWHQWLQRVGEILWFMSSLSLAAAGRFWFCRYTLTMRCARCDAPGRPVQPIEHKKMGTEIQRSFSCAGLPNWCNIYGNVSVGPVLLLERGLRKSQRNRFS